MRCRLEAPMSIMYYFVFIHMGLVVMGGSGIILTNTMHGGWDEKIQHRNKLVLTTKFLLPSLLDE